MLTIETTTVPARRYVGVRRSVKHDGIGAACAEILPRLGAWLESKNLVPAGEGDIAAGETPAGEALKAIHIGPYATLGRTWEAVFAHAAALNRCVTKSAWEIYIDDPRRVTATELRTEIYVPLDR